MAAATLMDGSPLALDIQNRGAERARPFLRDTGTRPCLATVLVGEDPASVTYVRMKPNRCEKVGIESRYVSLSADTTTREVVQQRTVVRDARLGLGA